MKCLVLVCAILLGLLAFTHASESEEWDVIGEASLESQLQFIVAIKQQNVKELNDIFWQVSDPQSPNYGKYLSHEEVSQLVVPKGESIEAVINWLTSNGIESYEFTSSSDMLRVYTTVDIASSWLNAKYLVHKHRVTGDTIIKSTADYVIPQEVKEHIDFVTGHAGFPLSRRPIFSAVGADAPITPVTLRQRYNVSSNLVGSARNNSLAVAEFQGQYYSPDDLKQFFQSEVPYDAKAYTVDQVVGQNDGSNPGVEANLDIQFIMGVAPGISAWFYSTPQMDFFTDMISWLAEIANATNPPLIHSVSYGSQTTWPSKDIHDRVDVEFQKIGARGISIIFASGDFGTGCLLCFEFRPSWPASSQYVTSVGATRFINGVSGAEMAVDEFGSGGGFSSADNQPQYQQSAVANYFKVQTDLPAAHFYNASGRGTPDVAALGIGFQVVVSGAVQSVGGTSASAPTFSAIVALLNDKRLNAGKAPMGFLNPWLYQTQVAHPDAFFDVTDGNNQHGCCGLTGFRAAPGWDPVTGLGTPNFAVLATLV
eukprot:Phypoly_transcript_06930.p1 GENE.Phypoly_transcript_06930~~Phypoly_transcript_06930.p1  ORF type:complete len:539 (+),score=108.07 Phypoly_transcript_06930:58-1674(+)